MKPTKIKLKAVAQGTATIAERTKLEKQRDVLQQCGLTKEARSIQKVITELNLKIKDYERLAKAQRIELVRQMFACFAVGDIATIAADNTESAFNELTYGRDKDDGKSFANIFRQQAKEWNKCVQMVDASLTSNERDFGLSMFYSNMAEEIVDAVLPLVYKMIDEKINSKEGKRWI